MPDSKGSVLIAVDVQKGFVTEHSRHVVQPIARLQERFGRVVFTKFHNPHPSPFRRILDYRKLSPGSDETGFALEPRRDALVIDRPHYTCVTAALKNHLREWGADKAYVCGIATEACVLKTVLDLFEANIRPLVIEDLCASDQDSRYHDIAIELMAKLVGKHNILSAKSL